MNIKNIHIGNSTFAELEGNPEDLAVFIKGLQSEIPKPVVVESIEEPVKIHHRRYKHMDKKKLTLLVKRGFGAKEISEQTGYNVKTLYKYVKRIKNGVSPIYNRGSKTTIQKVKDLSSRGMSVEDIARKLKISPITVKIYKSDKVKY
jgi:DNA-binding CsgD family transcriptional regulator